MQLTDPYLPCVFNWRVKKDNLVLDADLVDDRCQNQLSLRRLLQLTRSTLLTTREEDLSSHLLILCPLVSSLAVQSYGFPPTIAVVRPLKLMAPLLDDSSHPLKQDALDPLIELRYPVVQVSVAFQVQPVDLCRYI